MEMPGPSSHRTAAPEGAETPPRTRPHVPEEGADLRALLDLFWRRKVLVAACACLVFLVGIVDLKRTVPEYAATAILKLELDQATVFRFDEESNQGQMTDQLRTQIELIRSSAVAERVIDSLRLDEGEASAPDPGATRTGALSERIRDLWGRARITFRSDILGMAPPAIDSDVLKRQTRVQSLLDGLEVSQGG